jgi:aspartate dehydrogenase
MLRIGVIGCGTIGKGICKAIDDGTVKAELVAVYDRNTCDAEKLKEQFNKCKPEFMEIAEMVQNVDLLVECASQEAVYDIVPLALISKCDVMILSVGALADEELRHRIENLATDNSCKVYIPSGAIVGLDGLKSASIGEIYSATITTRKPPGGLAGAPFVIRNNIDLHSITAPRMLFEGPASEAVKAFPANVNVAATLSVAGIGFEKTMVRVIADPTITRNIHEITVEGSFGDFTTKVENVPSPSNPKSSYLAQLSAIATLKKISSPFQIGT